MKQINVSFGKYSWDWAAFVHELRCRRREPVAVEILDDPFLPVGDNKVDLLVFALAQSRPENVYTVRTARPERVRALLRWVAWSAPHHWRRWVASREFWSRAGLSGSAHEEGRYDCAERVALYILAVEVATHAERYAEACRNFAERDVIRKALWHSRGIAAVFGGEWPLPNLRILDATGAEIEAPPLLYSERVARLRQSALAVLGTPADAESAAARRAELLADCDAVGALLVGAERPAAVSDAAIATAAAAHETSRTRIVAWAQAAIDRRPAAPDLGLLAERVAEWVRTREALDAAKAAAEACDA